MLMILIITNSNTGHTTLQTLHGQELIASLIQEHFDGGVKEGPDGLDAEGFLHIQGGPLRWL